MILEQALSDISRLLRTSSDMEIVHEELHFYIPGTEEYEVNNPRFTQYQIVYIRGYKTLDSGSVNCIFIKDVDFVLIDSRIKWLTNGDNPSIPPAFTGYTERAFWVTYVYETTPQTQLRSMSYPFLNPNGSLIVLMDALGSQFHRILKMKDRVVRSRSLESSLGTELDMIGSWYNSTRFSGESDVNYRARLKQFFSTFLSSGTRNAIRNIMIEITGVVPSIEEYWAETSYYDYDPTDTTSFWVYDDGASDNVCTYYDFRNEPSTFYVIFSDYSVFPTYGPYTLKKVIDQAKAAGVNAYIGYLVEETFGTDDNNWARQATVPSGTGDTDDWSVTGGEYIFSDTVVTYHDGLSVIDNSDFDGEWGDYQITGYARDATGTANQMAGIVARWQVSGTDADEFYFFGISAADDKAYSYHWNGSTWDEKGATGGVSISGGVDTTTNYHLRIDLKGSAVRFYVNNVLVISDVDDYTALSTGRPGFGCFDRGTNAAITAYFDDMSVMV